MPSSSETPSRIISEATPPTRCNQSPSADVGHARQNNSRRWAFAAISLMLCAQAVVMTMTAARLTVTHDEYWHIPVGLLNWKTGRFNVEPLNPPLLRMWATWPLIFTSAKSPQTAPTNDLTKIGDEFLAANDGNIDRFVVIARLPIVLLTIGAGALLARWAWEWHGPWAACLVTWLWSREPNILAHGSLATTDAGGAAFWIFTLYATWRFAAQPTMRNASITGALLGLAQAAKFTNVLLVPLVFGLWLLQRWRNSSAESVAPRAAMKRWCMLLLIAWVCLNSAYLFRGTFTSLRSFDFASRSARAWQHRVGPLAALLVPLPRDYIVGIDRQKAFMEAEHPVFLDMVWNTTGFRHYYLMTLLYKWPHSIQLLLLWALAQSWLSCPVTRWRQQLWCVVPSTLMLVIASFSGMQLGIRYVLPVIPLSLLFIGQIAAKWSWPQPRWQQIAVAGLLVLFDPWHSHPEYLAYFNELTGGVEGGRYHLLDSNLDWGQDLHELKRFVDEHPQVQSLRLAYFGTLPPESLKLRYRPPPSGRPEPGWHAVSVNFVMGRPHWIRDGRGDIRAVDLGEFAYFNFFEPKQRIGASIDLYQLTQDDLRRWQAANAQ